LTRDLRRVPPRIHRGGVECWGLEWKALAWLERELEPGFNTLETGAGTSTIVFAAAATDHEAITPAEGERQRIVEECERRQISAARVSFHIGASHEVLAKLPPRPLDLVLIDGAHGFPYPILDWWFLAPRLRVGGRVLLDDCYLPPVAALADFLRAEKSWEVTAAPGRRTIVVRKLADSLPPFDWQGERIGGSVSFRHLPPIRRVRASVEHRLLESRLGRRAALLARREPLSRISGLHPPDVREQEEAESESGAAD
jgi:precorrin-6B methylase 2